jgi:nitroimidazol reductase NimA-like FMN-containing flavoprotein (pyridoxamine 5'-phosphate oxidase superfamily)
MSSSAEPPDDVRVRRHPERSAHDADSVHAVLDAGLIAHVGTVRDGKPVVIPMFYVRDGDSMLLHGAPAAGVLRRAQAGIEVCVTTTLLDGLVLARSAFNHSMNYRSVVVIGTAEPVTDPDEKAAALDRFVERLTPGRQDDLRPTTGKEIQGTTVLRLSLATASAKVRTGPPVDEDEDYALDIWAGVVPLETTYGPPEPDPRLSSGTAVPTGVQGLVRGSPEGPR